jgi:hypothetical protein
MAKITCQRPFECDVFPGTCGVFLVFDPEKKSASRVQVPRRCKGICPT